MRSGPYNGHKNWSHWNVALWLGNDEGLYRLALHHKDRAKHDRQGRERSSESSTMIAARRLQADLGGANARTQDGARWSLSALRAALAGLE